MFSVPSTHSVPRCFHLYSGVEILWSITHVVNGQNVRTQPESVNQAQSTYWIIPYKTSRYFCHVLWNRSQWDPPGPGFSMMALLPTFFDFWLLQVCLQHSACVTNPTITPSSTSFGDHLMCSRMKWVAVLTPTTLKHKMDMHVRWGIKPHQPEDGGTRQF